MNYKLLKERAQKYVNLPDSDEDACYIIEDLMDEIQMLEDKLIDRSDAIDKMQSNIDSLQIKISDQDDEIWDLKERLEVF